MGKMMDVENAYNLWAEQYDSNSNRTRDLEAIALRKILAGIEFSTCLEIGCGTGKNTEFLAAKADSVTAVDLSEEMLAKAKQKISSDNVQFRQADILKPWDFADKLYQLITFSLVLEHIEDLNEVFKKNAAVLETGGHVYVGELHPFRQYSGSKARFDTEHGEQVVPCFTHHISDFTVAAKKSGLDLIDVNEYFDKNDRSSLPRILALLFKKP